MKKTLCALMILAMLPLAALAAQAAPLEPAMSRIDYEALERYAGYSLDESTGEWSLLLTKTDAMLSYLESGRFGGGIVYFYPELIGNLRTGLTTPVLNICYLGNSTYMADTVSFAVDGVRYDLRAACAEASIGANRAEIMRVPMDGELIGMLRAVQAAGRASVRLIGQGHFDAQCALRERFDSTKQRIESAAIANLGEFLDLLTDLDFSADLRFRERAASWERLTGVLPEHRAVSLTSFERGGIELDDSFGLLSRGDQGANVRKLQDKLIEAGFLQGASDTAFGEGVTLAVERAQRYFGMMVTGSADIALLERLEEGVEQAAQAQAEAERPRATLMSASGACEAGAYYRVADIAELCLERYWFADAVAASQPIDALSERSAASADNTLAVFEGRIANVGGAELSFYWQMGGALVVDGKYEYALNIACERDGGRQFDSQMLPLAEARLIVYAEIPRAIAGDKGRTWALRLTVGDVALTYDLSV